MLPISSAPSQCGEGCVAAAPAAVDLELPLGVTLDNASGAVSALPGASATHHRVRHDCKAVACAAATPLGVLLKPDVIGKTLRVGFRALDAEHLEAGADVDSWVHASVRMVPRPNATLPKTLSTSLTYGLALSQWPTDVATGVTPLDTYAALGFNTVSDKTWSLPSNRTGWKEKGLLYGPEGGCPFSIPTMSVAAANSTNISSLCPGLSPSELAAEKTALVNAASFYATASTNDPTTSSGMDIGYDGCTRKVAIEKFRQSMAQSQPDVTFYDWEGWTDMEHWTRNVQGSANAQRQKLPGESQAELACKFRPRKVASKRSELSVGPQIGWRRTGWT